MLVFILLNCVDQSKRWRKDHPSQDAQRSLRTVIFTVPDRIGLCNIILLRVMCKAIHQPKNCSPYACLRQCSWPRYAGMRAGGFLALGRLSGLCTAPVVWLAFSPVDMVGTRGCPKLQDGHPYESESHNAMRRSVPHGRGIPTAMGSSEAELYGCVTCQTPWRHCLMC